MSQIKVVLLLSYVCIASISAAIITPALPIIDHVYALSHGALEWVISIFLFGYVIGQLIYAPLANRYGRLVALRIGLCLNLVGILLCLESAMALNYPFLLIGRLITALGAASGLSCTFMLLNESLSEERAKLAMGFVVLSFTLGVGFSVFIGGIITEYLNWYDCFWFLLIHGILMLLLTWYLRETLIIPKPLHVRAIAAGYLKAFKSSTVVIFALIAGFATAINYGYAASAPMYAQLHLHLSPSQYGYWNLITMVGMFGGGILSTFLIKKIGMRRTLLFAQILLFIPIISLILLTYLSSAGPFWFFSTTLLLYLLSSMLFATGSYFASNAIEDKASASSAMSFINMGGGTISVIIIGYLPFSSIVSYTVTITTYFIAMIFMQSHKRGCTL